MNKVFNKVRIAVLSFILYRNVIDVFLNRIGARRRSIVAILRNGTRFPLRKGSLDMQVINEVYMNKIYDEALKKRPLAPVIIDIGANIGAFAMRAVDLCHRPKIYAFEPYRENFSILKKTISLNKSEVFIVPIEKCVVGKEKGSMYLNTPINKEGSSSLYSDKNERYQRRTMVKATTLGKAIQQYGLASIDLLKLDCEGAEFDILYNLADNDLARIKRIILEYHEYFGTGSAKELRSFLEEKGFKVRLQYAGPLGMLFAQR